MRPVEQFVAPSAPCKETALVSTTSRRWSARAAALALPLTLSLAASPAAHAEGRYNQYDQGVRHVATLAGYLSYGLMALTVCFGILTTTVNALAELTTDQSRRFDPWGRSVPVPSGALDGGHRVRAWRSPASAP